MKTNKILALALMAVAMIFASCSKDSGNPVAPTQQEIETKIIGKWKIIKMDGKDVTTNTRSIDTYYSEGKGYTSVSNPESEGSMASWMNKLGMTYIINGNELVKNTGLTAYSVINTISDSKISMMFTKIVDNGKVYVHNRPAEYAKVTVDYSKDIIGLWEGMEMTGYETYGDAEARIEYRADGTYTYYVKDGDLWVPSINVGNEYNVDGDWLAHRWCPKAGADYNYEWWDIDEIKDGIMKWSAFREKEDGERFTTTFTWKKVEMPTQQEIEEKIIGRWKVAEKEGEPYLTNRKVVLTFNDKGECLHSFAREVKPIEGYFWVNKYAIPYQVEGNFVCISDENDPDYKSMAYVINNISGDMFSYDERIITQRNGKIINDKGRHVYKRVTADYSKDIIGMWEGVAMTGYETYGDTHHRIEYRADGTYTYYNWDETTQVWTPLTDVIDEWNVDGDWLATRWQNNGSDVMNYEWWDIDYIKDGIMKWSAFREKEDGERFTTTFTWKKVK